MIRWKKAGVVENRFESDRVHQALQEANIPFLMKSFLDTAYDGLFIPQKGWGAVMVPEDFLEDAKRLIGDVKKTFEKEGVDETEQCGGDSEVCHPEGNGRGSLLPDDGGSVKSRD